MPADHRPLAIALMGPTASGKTALAMEWAQRFGGEIVSVDSALVYRGLDIGAAKPEAAMLAAVPHHLIDLREPWQPYSAAEFAADARAAVGRDRRAWQAADPGRRHRPVFPAPCWRAWRRCPKPIPRLRATIAAEAADRGWPALHARTRSRSTRAPPRRINPTDPQRIQRALEVFRLSGTPISEWQAMPARDRLPFRVLKLVLAPRDRAVLHQRIEQRFDAMLEAGFLQEVERLRALPRLQAVERPLDLPAIRAVGYRQAWEYLDGTLPEAEFRDRAIFATRQLAKRQLTWLRGRTGRALVRSAGRQGRSGSRPGAVPARGFGYCVAGQAPVVV